MSNKSNYRDDDRKVTPKETAPMKHIEKQAAPIPVTEAPAPHPATNAEREALGKANASPSFPVQP